MAWPGRPGLTEFRCLPSVRSFGSGYDDQQGQQKAKNRPEDAKPMPALDFLDGDPDPVPGFEGMPFGDINVEPEGVGVIL